MNVAVVIPSFKVKEHILSVISGIGPRVGRIYVVDDKCPVSSGQFVLENCRDLRVEVLFNQENQGVGGATMAGYRRALLDGVDIVGSARLQSTASYPKVYRYLAGYL